MKKNKIKKTLLQALGTSQLVHLLYESNRVAHEGFLDFDGCILEALLMSGCLTYDEVMSPFTPGQKEAMQEIDLDPLEKKILAPLALCFKAMYGLETQGFDVGCLIPVVRAEGTYNKILDSIGFPGDHAERLNRAAVYFPKINEWSDGVNRALLSILRIGI